MKSTHLGALALLVCCSCWWNSDNATATVRFTAQQAVPASALRVTVTDNNRARTWRAADMHDDGISVTTPTVNTDMHGTLTVDFALQAGTDIGHGTLSLDLKPDWGWFVDIQVDSANPTRYCFGCMGSKSFPLAAAFRRVASDSIWVTWGGNSIKNPVIY